MADKDGKKRADIKGARHEGTHIVIFMDKKTSKLAGTLLFALGFAMIVFNAADYLAGWNSVPTAFFIIGIVFLGAGAAMRKREST